LGKGGSVGLSFSVPPKKCAILGIDGMTCNSCVQTIQNNISNVNGVESINVSLKDKEGRIIFFPDEINEQALVTEIEDMGFDAFIKAVEQLVQKDQSPSKSLPENTKETKFKVYGMTCQSCVRAIKQNLSEINGFVSAEVSVDDNEAIVRYNCDETNTATLKESIEDCGFEVYIQDELSDHEPKKIALRISGMTFPSCVDTIRQTLQSTDGVKEVDVELNSEKTEIWYQPAIIDPATLIKLVQDKGFEATIIYPNGRTPEYKSVLISIEGMTCNSCVKSIEGTVGDIPGVTSIKVSLEEKTGEIIFNPDITGENNLRDAIDDMGFEAAIKEHQKPGGFQSFCAHVDMIKCPYLITYLV
jgi:Cu+-exporting ATPase